MAQGATVDNFPIIINCGLTLFTLGNTFKHIHNQVT